MRAAIYARVSSARQRDAHTIESQLRVLRRYVAEQGWTLAGEYVDDGRSAKAGKLEARDGFARLARDAGARMFDVLVVVDVDRLTRTDDMRERAEILGPFQRANVKIVTPTGGELDLRTFLGELYVTMQALVAAEENRKRAERIKAGKARAIAEGRKPAGPTPFGWTYSRELGQWGLHAQNAETTREAFRRVIGGESCVVIADDFHDRGLVAPGGGQWQRHKVWQIVTRRHAVGEWRADKRQRLVIAIPPIVTEATWEAAQAALIAHGKRGLVRLKHNYLLQGLATCELCGSPIAIRSATTNSKRSNGNPSPPAYVCRARKLDYRRGDVRCTLPISKVADVDARVWAKVSAGLESPGLAERVKRLYEETSANHTAWQADVDRYQRKLEQLVRAEAGTAARYRKGLLSEEAYDIELAAARKDRTAIERQLDAARDALRSGVDGVPQVDAKEWARAMRALARSTSPDDRQRVVRQVARRVVFTRAGDVTFDLVVARSRAELVGEVDRRLSPVVSAGYSSDHGDSTERVATIRIVA